MSHALPLQRHRTIPPQGIPRSAILAIALGIGRFT
jgi:hypothetical protein